MSKIIEKVILTRLLQHLSENNLLPPRQYGFMPGRSTTSALTDLIEHLIDNLDDGNTTVGIFLDLSKAFDSLDHKMLLAKINSLGVTGTALNWFTSYLQGRKQIVEVKQVSNGALVKGKSKPMTMRRGVPQGSVLGPVLFVLFTGDFPDCVEDYCYPVSYADDTVLITWSKNVQELELNTLTSVNTAQEYCLNNDLVFNSLKTKCLTLGRHKKEALTPPNLEKVQVIKHLGVMIDDHLTWKCHIDVLCKKLSSALFVLRRLKAIGTPIATRTAYHALFESRIRYGVILWGGASAGNLHRVLVTQKKAIRIMADLGHQDSCREAFKTMKIPTVTALYITEVILHALTHDLLRNSDIHGYPTRRAADINIQGHRSTLFTKKPSYAGAQLYNMLPRDLKACPPLTMKKNLLKWLVKQPIYTIEEFKNTASSRYEHV